MSHKSAFQECPTRVSCKSVPQECPTRVTHKSILQECPRRVSHKSVLQECHLDICSFSNVFAFGFVGSILFFVLHNSWANLLACSFPVTSPKRVFLPSQKKTEVLGSPLLRPLSQHSKPDSKPLPFCFTSRTDSARDPILLGLQVRERLIVRGVLDRTPGRRSRQATALAVV